MIRSALLALLALATLAAACSSPGTGVSYFPPGDTTDSDGVLDPDALFPSDTASPQDTATPADTTPVDTTPADTATPVDTATPADAVSCVVGNACTDNDPCTVNDQCVAGTCQGQALTCDDNNPCTVDSCSNAVCHHAPPPGQCLIGDACVPDQQPNPSNACQRCVAAQNTVGWSNADGLKCDDQNPCTDGEQCSGGQCTGGVTPAEVCDDNVDNDCNGKTDDQDGACNANQPCVYHTDCYPERVCGYWPSDGQNHCSGPCTSSASCPPGQVCVKVPGSAQMAYCRDGVVGLLVNGAGCADDSQCQSGLCTGVCEDLCMNEQVCNAANYTCHPVGDLAAGQLSAACSPNGSGKANGQICLTADGQYYDASVCASGHCDLLATTPTCAPVCKSEFDCTPSQECNVVLYGSTEDAGTVPFDPQFTQATYAAFTGCYTPPASGSGAVGQQCSTPSQCSSYKCLALTPGDPTMYCTTLCEFDSECPTGMKCKQDGLSLTSAWLQAAGTAAPGGITFVRICKWE